MVDKTTRWTFYRFGWYDWMFGFTYYPKNKAAWVCRWKIRLGPISIGWLTYPENKK